MTEQIEKLSDWKPWLIGVLTALLLLFGGFYLENVSSSIMALRTADEVLLRNVQSHSERLTTLEESKRNSENLLKEIKSDLEEIKREIRAR